MPTRKPKKFRKTGPYRYKFDYELHHEFGAMNKKEAIKKARAIMRKRKKTGIWFNAKVTRVKD